MSERIRMTAAEFFQMPETTQFHELLDGELIVSPTPTPPHQSAVVNTLFVLRDLIPNGRLFVSPMSVYLDDANIPEPDVIWVAENSRCVIGEKYLEGPPDLLVEVFSPSTAKRDKDDKFELYQRYNIYEYWMLDPINRYVEVLSLKDGRFLRQGVYGMEDTFTPPILGGANVQVRVIFTF